MPGSVPGGDEGRDEGRPGRKGRDEGGQRWELQLEWFSELMAQSPSSVVYMDPYVKDILGVVPFVLKSLYLVL